MLYGVISDVHSNLEALQAVLRILSVHQVEGYICCGDVVGYGPSPNEVIDTIASLKGLYIVSGNHDLAVIGKMSVEWFNDHAQKAILWTRQKLSAPSHRFLDSLSPRIETSGFTLVHGSPRNPTEEYILTRQQFLDNLTYFKVSPCFVGHSHLTCCFGGNPKDQGGVEARLLKDGQTVNLDFGRSWIVNPGSVGQPRDRDPRASCGLYDDVKREFQILRVPYDIGGIQQKMRAANLPEFLAMRLNVGQ